MRRNQRNGCLRRRAEQGPAGRKEKQLRRKRSGNEQPDLKSPEQRLGEKPELHGLSRASWVWRKRQEGRRTIRMNQCHKYGLRKR